jgi:hypothetical protein
MMTSDMHTRTFFSPSKWILLLLAWLPLAQAQAQEPSSVSADLWFAGAPGGSFDRLFYLNGDEITSVDLIPSQAIGPLAYRGSPELVFYKDKRSFALPPDRRPTPDAKVQIETGSRFLLFMPIPEMAKLRVFPVAVDPGELTDQSIRLFNLTRGNLMGYVNQERVEMEPGASRLCGPMADAKRGVPVVIFQLAQQQDTRWVRAYENKLLVRGTDRILMFLYRDDKNDVRSASYKL